MQEVWTLCRIFKRIPSHQKKFIALTAAASSTKPNCNQQLLGYHHHHHHDINSMIIPPSPPCLQFNQDSLINIHQNHEMKLKHTTTTTNNNNVGEVKDERNHMLIMDGELGEASPSPPPLESYCYPSFWNPMSSSVMSEQDIFATATWDELGSVVHMAMDDPFIKGLLS